ncbi:FAD-binding oxidoreductase [Acuticoccus sediminis]|uniref:FAD-binding oxidoreductase n=1 Tax=Acuticoccus sediminis TaxID=2184697 RepID=UPI001CFDAC67|nr:FAD-binding oxidoreductase [Acuticoccus sediminis]
MDRRRFLALGAVALAAPRSAVAAPDAVPWERLAREVGSRLQPVEWPLGACAGGDTAACDALFENARNPFFLGDHPGLAQSFGWTDGWALQPSARVVVAETAGDVSAAVRFAADTGVRLVVKGGGHSYHGDSNAAGSLLLWTRRMDAVVLHDGFVPSGSDAAPQPAVSVGAGAMWGEVYRRVSVEGGRYVQGGGCLTVGVAGLVLSGGFGSFSPRFGLAAANLLEAEVVTADGAVRTVNAAQEPDLFFALKGGGGGFAVVTRVTLRTHPLPRAFGLVAMEVEAASEGDYRTLVRDFLVHYRTNLSNPAWGEQAIFRPDNRLRISMLFSDIDEDEARAVWEPFFARVRGDGALRLGSEPVVVALPGRSFWDPEVLSAMPGVVLRDTQPGAPPDRIYWAGNAVEAGKVTHGFGSVWLRSDLLADPDALAGSLVAASRHWPVSLHFNKGLAFSGDAVRTAALDTAMNPEVTRAFALAISGAEGPPAYPGVPGHAPDAARGRSEGRRVAAAIGALRAATGATGSYSAESDYVLADWASAYWGENAGRLRAIKRARDPRGLFVQHHGPVG